MLPPNANKNIIIVNISLCLFIVFLGVLFFGSLIRASEEGQASTEVGKAYSAFKTDITPSTVFDEAFVAKAISKIEATGVKAQRVNEVGLKPTEDQVLVWAIPERMEITAASSTGTVYYARITNRSVELWKTFQGKHKKMELGAAFQKTTPAAKP